MNPTVAIMEALRATPAEAAERLNVPTAMIEDMLAGARQTVPLKLLFGLSAMGWSRQQISAFCTTYDTWRYDQRQQPA